MRLTKLVLTVAASVASSGCATGKMPAGIEYCQVASRIWYNSEAELQATPLPIVQQIEIENSKYERLCLGNKKTLQ